MREARINARLHHPHVVAVFDAVEYEGQPVLVMELVPSETLAEALREQRTVEPSDAARVGSQVASALAAAHGLGIVHRDVKPSNILIGDDGRARISDFGISRAFDDTTLTTTGMVFGTPAYLAPEVARGCESTPAADVFSLGSTLYAALEGAPPFGTDGSAIALMYKVAEGDFPTPRRAGDIAPLLGRMLSRDPETRPAMDEVATTLSKLGGDGAGPLSEDSAGVTTVPIPPPADARPVVGAVCAVGAGAAVVAAGADGAAVGGSGAASAATPDSPTAEPPVAESDVATPTHSRPTTAEPPAEAPPVPDQGPSHRRGWIAAVVVAAVLVAAVLVATLLWPRSVPPSPSPNATAVPAESGRSEPQSDGPTGDETDARETERTDSSETHEPTEDSTNDSTNNSTEDSTEKSSEQSTEESSEESSDESTASDEPTETSEPSETNSQPNETQSGGDG